MWNGSYSFFDWKGDIVGYSGQDYDGAGRYIYLFGSILLLIVLLVLLRKTKREHIRRYLQIVGIFMIALCLAKTIWESYFDITKGPDHAFNIGLLPFDTCSIIMLAAPLAGFGKGKIEKLGACWLACGGILGGTSNLLFLQALHYYPFWTFGAFYSMIWHFLMVFTGLWLLVTNYVEANFKTVLYAFVLHMAYSVIVIPFAYAFDMDFMLYLRAGGAPLIEILGEKLYQAHLSFLTTLLMIGVYFGCFAAIIYATKGIKALIGLISRKHSKSEA